MLSERVEFGDKGSSNELKMLMELLKSGSIDEQRMLAQTLLELDDRHNTKREPLSN